jgi:N-acetylglutamate synthase-like GNAT family acetyltransferase
MPVDFAPCLAQMLEPSLDLPGTVHYMAELDGQPAGVISLLCNDQFGVLGSAGVAPAFRRRGAIYALAAAAGIEAQQRGIETLIVQTTAGMSLERLLRISGFRQAFTRACYVLP